MHTRIACLDLDAFFVEAALREHPELRGKPVAVGGTSGRGVICSASYEARAFGVRAALPFWMAKQRCPRLIMLPVPASIEALSRRVHERLTELCPVVEPASIDEFYLDFSGCDRIYPHNLDIVDRIRQAIATDPGLPATIGIGTNKLIAKIASNLGKPRGILEVFPGCEARFLAPLPLQELPGVGPRMLEVLQSMGLSTIGEILTVPVETWRAALGRTGENLYRAATGMSDSIVHPPEQRRHRKGLSHERTLSQDTASRGQLLALLSGLVEKAAYRLRQEQMTCGGVTLKLRYADFETQTRSCRLDRTNQDGSIFQAVTGLFVKLFTRRVKVRLVGIRLDAIQAGGVTPDLWESLNSEQQRQLPVVVDLIRARYGFKSVLHGRSVPRPAPREARHSTPHVPRGTAMSLARGPASPQYPAARPTNPAIGTAQTCLASSQPTSSGEHHDRIRTVC